MVIYYIFYRKSNPVLNHNLLVENRLDLDRALGKIGRSRRQSTHELVAAVLREAITTGQLRGNQPLPQDEIASQLRVSHIPVREALRQLESEGLVSYEPNRGATVTDHTPEEIREIYEIRTLLETAAIHRAASRLTQEQLDRAAAMLDRAEAMSDGGAWGSLDVEFHQMIYDLDARPRHQELITGLLRQVDRYWLSHGLMLQHRDRFDREHRELLGAIRARDAERAARLLAIHLGGASELLVTALSGGEGTVPRPAP